MRPNYFICIWFLKTGGGEGGLSKTPLDSPLGHYLISNHNISEAVRDQSSDSYFYNQLRVHWKNGLLIYQVEVSINRFSSQYSLLTLKASIATKVVLFSSAEMFKKPSIANSVDPDQTAPIGAVCSGSTLFASILNSSVMLGNYLQQTTSADDIFRCIFFLALQGLIRKPTHLPQIYPHLR